MCSADSLKNVCAVCAHSLKNVCSVCPDSLKNLCLLCEDSFKNVCAVCVRADSLKIELKSRKWECFLKPEISLLCRNCETAGDFVYEVQGRLFL